MVERTDPVEKRARLEAWLRTKLPHAEDLALSPLDKAAGGFGSEIHFIDLKWRERGEEKTLRLVMREEPVVLRVFPEYNIAAEFHTMRCLENTGIPVPKMYWLEEDKDVIGVPFYVMERIDGEVLDPQQPGEEPMGPLYEATPEGRGKIFRQAIEVIAKINSVNWKSLEIPCLPAPKSGIEALDRHIAFYEGMAKWAAVEPRALIDAALEWFKKNRFEPKHVGLCWGDARLGNLMYREGRVVGVLDWDMVHTSAAESDLAWLLAVDWLSQDVGLRGPRWDGVPDREEIMRCYESVAGRSLENFFYHEAFAMLRLGIIFWRVIKAMPGIPPDFAPDVPPLRKLANMLKMEDKL